MKRAAYVLGMVSFLLLAALVASGIEGASSLAVPCATAVTLAVGLLTIIDVREHR
jgi:hypothetical protein